MYIYVLLGMLRSCIPLGIGETSITSKVGISYVYLVSGSKCRVGRVSATLEPYFAWSIGIFVVDLCIVSSSSSSSFCLGLGIQQRYPSSIYIWQQTSSCASKSELHIALSFKKVPFCKDNIATIWVQQRSYAPASLMSIHSWDKSI